MDSIVDKLLLPLLLLVGQLWLNSQFKVADEKRDAAHADTRAEREETRQWRASMMERMDSQDKKISLLILTQATDMRSDIIHKCHRYLDDLGMASIEEKEALSAQHEEYKKFCDTNNLENNFIDRMVERVMELPERNAIDISDDE